MRKTFDLEPASAVELFKTVRDVRENPNRYTIMLVGRTLLVDAHDTIKQTPEPSPLHDRGQAAWLHGMVKETADECRIAYEARIAEDLTAAGLDKIADGLIEDKTRPDNIGLSLMELRVGLPTNVATLVENVADCAHKAGQTALDRKWAEMAERALLIELHNAFERHNAPPQSILDERAELEKYIADTRADLELISQLRRPPGPGTVETIKAALAKAEADLAKPVFTYEDSSGDKCEVELSHERDGTTVTIFCWEDEGPLEKRRELSTLRWGHSYSGQAILALLDKVPAQGGAK